VKKKAMGVCLKTEKRRAVRKYCVDKGQRRRAARFERHLHAESLLAISPVAFRPPHPLLKAGYCGVASSFFVLRQTPMA
jgi:hypothetical protein